MTRRGFTLFEVLIALGVFAIAVTGLVIGLQSTLDAALTARQRALARFVIESRLAASMTDRDQQRLDHGLLGARGAGGNPRKRGF